MITIWGHKLATIIRVIRMDRTAIIIPIVSFLCILGCSLLGVMLIFNSINAYHREVINNIANNIIHSLDTGISATIQPAMAIHSMILQHQDWSIVNKTFYELAPFLVNNSTMGAIITIVLAPFAIAQSIYPSNLPGWEQVKGLDLLKDPHWRTDALKTIKLAKFGMTMTGPVVLKAGPMGLVARSPVFMPASRDDQFGLADGICAFNCSDCYDDQTHSKFWGFSQLNVDWNTLVNNVSNIFSFCNSNGASFDIVYTNPVSQINQTVASCGNPLKHGKPIIKIINIMHNTWYLRINQTGSWYPLWLWMAISTCIIVSIIISALVFMFMVQRRKYIWLVKSVLPSKVVKVLRKGESYSEEFPLVTVLFSDIVSYTTMSASLHAIEVVKLLNELYGEYDELVDRHQCVKIETIGDAFMAACGTNKESPQDSAKNIVSLAIDMVKVTKEKLFNGQQVKIRIGVNSGPAVGAVIGFKMPHFCLCGDTINTASRMETNSEPYRIHVSKETADLLSHNDFTIIPRGIIQVKGKGFMNTFWIKEISNDSAPPSSSYNISEELPKLKTSDDGVNRKPSSAIDLRFLR